VVLGDTDWSTPAEWTLTDGGNSANVLTLATTSGSPAIQVDAATSPTGDTVDVPAAAETPSNLDLVLAGTGGFTKTGVGTLQILKPATISGPLTISKGIVQVGPGGALAPSSVSIATSQQLRIAGGTFSTTGNVTWTSGTGTGIIVSAGTGNFQRILPSNSRNSFVKVTGGTFTATEINYPRSGDSESQAIAAGVQISGGDATVGLVSLGTADSWGSLSVSGGRMTVTNALTVGWQKTSTRGGVVNVSGGELNVTDPATGLILARNPGGSSANANNVAKFTITGGVSNVARIVLGFDATSTAGSGTVSVTNGTLNVGSGGIVKNGTSGMVTTVALNSGVLGALANWSTTHPITAGGAPDMATIRAGNASGTSFDVTLGGGVVGAGGFTKTGSGTLTLGGTSTFAGGVVVNAGTLAVAGNVGAGGDAIFNAGTTLTGSGSLGRAAVLNDGATTAPAGGAIGTLSVGSLVWNGSATLAADLGASGTSDRLAISGALSRGSGAARQIALNPTAGVTAGATYTLATFASTDCAADDFVVSGLPANYAGAVSLSATSLQVTVLTTPVVTSAGTASGVYGQPFSYAITAANAPASYSASGLPPGLTVDAASGAISGTPGAAGSYNVTLSASNLAGTGTATLTLSVAPAPASISLGGLSATYDGAAHAVTATTVPAGLPVAIAYDGSATAPTNAGTYNVAAAITDPNYAGSASAVLTIAKASQSITFPNPGTKTFGDAPFALAAAASSGLPVSYVVVSGPATVSGSTLTITGAGSVVVRASQAGNGNYMAAPTVDATFSVSKATAAITFGGLRQPYDGTPRVVTVTTDPAGLTVNVTYNGQPTAPTKPGSYVVVATIDDPNYTGSQTDTLVVTATALVRHAPVLNGALDGSLQVLLPESFALDAGAYVASDILVPGTPNVRLNGHPTFVGTQDSDGATAPSNYTLTLNGGATARYVVRRVDAIALTSLSAPQVPGGTRSVIVNSAGESIGDPATLRNLTLNGGAGTVSLPAGAYGDVTLNSGTTLVLGSPNATVAAVYDLQRLSVNGNAIVAIAGPVILRVAGDVVVNGTIGSAAAESVLRLELSAGSLTLNGQSKVFGEVLAPAGTVTLNGGTELHGNVEADRLTINGNAVLQEQR
jgi:rhamnogalacturonan endolyase